MNYVDISLLLVLFLITFLCAHKGLFHVLSQFAASVISLVAARLLSQPIAAFVYTRFFAAGVRAKLTQLLPAGSVSGELQKVADAALQTLPDFVQKLAAQFHLLDLLHAGAGGEELLPVEQIEAQYLAPLITKAFSVVCFIALFALLAFLLKGFALWLDRTFFDGKGGMLGRFNQFAGALLGVLRSLLAVFVIAMLLNLAASLIQAPAFQQQVVNSYICNFISTWI